MPQKFNKDNVLIQLGSSSARTPHPRNCPTDLHLHDVCITSLSFHWYNNIPVARQDIKMSTVKNMMNYIDLSGVLFAGLAKKVTGNFSIDFRWSVQYHDIYQSDWISLSYHQGLYISRITSSNKQHQLMMISSIKLHNCLLKWNHYLFGKCLCCHLDQNSLGEEIFYPNFHSEI